MPNIWPVERLETITDDGSSGGVHIISGWGKYMKSIQQTPPKQRGIGILSMKLCLKEQAGAFLADGGCGGEVPWGEGGLGNAQHRERLSCVESAVGAEVRGGEPGGREEAAMMRRLLWGEGARSCGNSTAWREARESVEGTRRSGAEEPEVCRRSGCRKRSGQRLASCSV